METLNQFKARHLGEDARASATPAFSALVQSATVEFLSSMQLLAERARFLTGSTAVAIAVRNGPEFVYRASAGHSAEVGSTSDTRHAPIANCIASAKPCTVSAHTSRGQLARAAVPVIRHQEVAGFFELSASRSSFSNEDMTAVSDLAEMVNTALDHMDAAENAHRQILETNSPAKLETPTPVSWHASSETETSSKSDVAQATAPLPLQVHTCQACGFPISDGRKLCVECEQKPGAQHVRQPQFLAAEQEESWIAAHGYTIASLLATALVAAIVYWLR
jgi:hypothetical protein